ncbi:HAD family hydrolase [Nocardia sp. NBC_00416]|uniref:HAD family hydrolase n=1 Tax=Nocardia sp. NBC_00416 TaxID=2975991 RepID=UPI002E1B5C3B
MAIRGVLFDFSGTLFRFEPVLDGVVDRSGERLTGKQHAEVMRRMTAPVGRPGGLPEELSEDWDNRDLDPALHRALYSAVLRGSGVGNPDYLYDQLVSPESWAPYPDTGAALGVLAAAAIPVAVVSNIAWDIRAVFEYRGVADQVAAYVLSYVEGMVKPDPRLFAIACERVGVVPSDVLMIGDSAEADGGAAEIGCAFALVDPVAGDRRPRALIDVLTEYGIG